MLQRTEKFLFDLYDKDGSKILSEKNIQEFVIDLYGASYTLIPEARSAYAHIPVGTINFADFKNYLHSQPTLISNADVLQNQLRKFIVGDAFWRRLSRRS